jgi:phosphatidylglycerophosphate synthase
MTNRRPIAARNTGLARRAATALAARGVSPNHISQASVGFAALAGMVFWAGGAVGPVLQAILFVVAAVAVQGRLLCNLLDGMVAIEGGQRASDGPFWNEAPDRLADLLILWGVGAAAGLPALGLLAGALAVTTAYLRELGRAEGMPPDFSGPMAKPHRMALVTVGAVLAAGEALLSTMAGDLIVLPLVLWVLVIGTAGTVLRRSLRLIRWMGR